MTANGTQPRQPTRRDHYTAAVTWLANASSLLNQAGIAETTAPAAVASLVQSSAICTANAHVHALLAGLPAEVYKAT